MVEMLTVLPPENYGTGERLKEPPVCVETKPPVFIEYTPEYKREHGISNEIDRLPQGLERTPNEDEFCMEDRILGSSTQLKAFKAPSPAEVISAITAAKEIFEVMTDAVNSGRNLYEAFMGWINSDKNKNMTDTQKVQAMQLANVMAKQITAEQSQKQLNLAA